MVLYIPQEYAQNSICYVLNYTDRLLSQQIGADVEGKLVSEDAGKQTEQTFKNLQAILKVSSSSLERVLKVNIYLVDRIDYSSMNEVYVRVCSGLKSRNKRDF
jgi:enamine deaminase RidA (YjgF/YER057c/UK114 family)